MEVDKIGNTAATAYYSQQRQLADKTNMTGNAQGPALDTGTQSGDQVRLATSQVTRKNLDVVKAIEQEHAKLNLLAKDARKTNEELDRTAGQVNRMNANLTTIIKNNPPFPPDSAQRQEILMSYASIRQEIIKMTVPPPPAPVYEKVKGMWSSLFGQNGLILHNAVPELHAASSDWEVQAAASRLDNTGGKLADLSSGVTQALIQS